MRKRHLWNEETHKTMCGHPMTHQERRVARINTLRTINCKNCERIWVRTNDE